LQGSEELNVLKSHLQVTIRTLLQGGASQREIERATGVDRKTIRRYEREAKSPRVATGSEPGKTGGESRLT
jgi:transposase